MGGGYECEADLVNYVTLSDGGQSLAFSSMSSSVLGGNRQW